MKGFAQYELEDKENHPATVKEKLRKLNEAYEYWQADLIFPHPDDYNPVKVARLKIRFDAPETKEPPRIPLDELREILSSMTSIRDQAIIVIQLKLGLRASELSNIKLAEVSLQNAEVRKHYPELGTHPMLEEYPNALYIPHDREGNKSKRPRLLPLDDETRRVLLQYLLIRPDNGEPWVFLSNNHHEKVGNQGVIAAWKNAFHPKYDETERHRAVTSHFGRHYFTTYWTVEQEANRELVKYMRGDTTARNRGDGPPGVIETYIHTYYEDIEPLYREEIFKLGI